MVKAFITLPILLFTLFVLCVTDSARSLDRPHPPTRFYFVSRSGDKVRIEQWRADQSSRPQLVTESVRQAEIKDVRSWSRLHVADVQVSPNGKYLAVGLAHNGFGPHALVSTAPSKLLIINLSESPSVLGDWEIDRKRYGQSFKWVDSEVIGIYQWVRKNGDHNFENVWLSAQPPHWDANRLPPDSPIISKQLDPPSPSLTLGQLRAAELLTKRGYTLGYVSPPTLIPPEDEGWHSRPKLGGYTGAVSSSGNEIAALVDVNTKEGEFLRYAFIVLRRKTDWKEERLPIDRRVERVQMWGNWLAVTTSDEHRELFSVSVYSLNDLSLAATIPSDAATVLP